MSDKLYIQIGSILNLSSFSSLAFEVKHQVFVQQDTRIDTGLLNRHFLLFGALLRISTLAQLSK
jgi:hypothetical protein